MKEYLFSASVNSFYPKDMKHEYINAGTLPQDCVEVDENCFKEFTSKKDGFIRSSKNGLPFWIDNKNIMFKEFKDDKHVKNVSHAKQVKIEQIRDQRDNLWDRFDKLYLIEERYNGGAKLDDLKALGIELQNAPQKAEELLQGITTFDDVCALTLYDCIEIPQSIDL